MFHCPSDGNPLERTGPSNNVFWHCPSCGGRTATISALRRTADLGAIDQLWSAARTAPEGSRPCPACERPMKAVSLPTASGPMQLDVCTRCFFVWFDAKEYEAMPPPGLSRKDWEARLPLDARLMMAKVDVDALDPLPDIQIPQQEPPAEPWKRIPAFFGLPVKQDSDSLSAWPVASWGLTAIVAVFGMVAFLDLPHAALDWGLVPDELWRYDGLTLLTYFFLHGSAPQLAGNLYFLAAFGDDVEDYLGSGRFLILLLCCTIAGGLLHALLQPRNYVPLVGASAAISGMLVYYGLQFPNARIGFLVRLPMLYFMRWFHLRAWIYVIGWIALQAIGAVRQTGSFTQVSLLAHLGGAGMGFLFWFFWPGCRQPESEPRA